MALVLASHTTSLTILAATLNLEGFMGIRWAILAVAGTLVISLGAADAQVTLKVVMHSDLKIAISNPCLPYPSFQPCRGWIAAKGGSCH
jgi:hypothetical protein